MKNNTSFQKNIVTNYNDIDYENDFWQIRKYEDLIEKNLLKKLLNSSYNDFLDLGGGFGRLVPVYSNRTKNITLLDYSDKLLESAKKKLMGIQDISFIQGNFYNLPFEKNTFDGGCSIRVIHHVENPSLYFSELNRVLKKDAEFILEFANKRNLLEIFRSLLKKENSLNPFSKNPENRSKDGLTYNFHPKYIKELAEQSGFKIIKIIDSSLLRSSILKHLIGQTRLASIENNIPFMFRRLHLSPSVFVKIKKILTL
jgi:ubiquinone/menaquinone biosynthesis C-methylase UbiE